MPDLEDAGRPAEVSALRARVAIARGQRRSRSEFQELKPDVFYYLFSLVASVMAAWLMGASSLGLRSMITAGLCFGFLCYVPMLWNRLCYWALIQRPNRLVERKIATLDARSGSCRVSDEGRAGCEG